MMRVLTQDMVNRDTKELLLGMQQILDDHSQIVQMMSQLMASGNNNLSQNNLGSKEPRGDAEITLHACKICGKIGQTFKEFCEQCPYCDTSHPNEKSPMAQITCFLCDGINHVPTECNLYPMVQRMNQQAEDGLFQLLGSTPEDRRSKMKAETKVIEIAPDVTTKSRLSGGRQGRLPRSCSRKRERFSTAIAEYDKMDVRDLLALERPKKKKHTSKVLCFNCKELGHYANKCLERNNKANRQGSVKKDLSLITCYKCKQKGHYADKCAEKSTTRLQ
jgi:hypothetical protein